MSIAIIASSKDPAGRTIHAALRRLFSFKESTQSHGNVVHSLEKEGKTIALHLISTELIHSDDLDKKIDADLFVFASKHRSSSNTKSFAVHSIGNWGDAGEAGGRSKTLCPTSARLQQAIFLEILKRGREGYEITMEATHHGPHMEKPSVFVEVGSTEEEWADDENARILALSIMEGLLTFTSSPSPVAIGIGGPHYCNNFNKLSQRKSIAFGHICPKHHLDKLNEDLLRQAIEKNNEKLSMIVLDWKGLGQEKQRVLELVKGLEVPIERTDQLLKESAE